MKQLIPAGFLFLYLLASTELQQFVYLPTLIHHYIEHRTENPSISFAGFVMAHYLHGGNHSDYARHQSLPFKNHKCPEVSLTIALPPDDTETAFQHDYRLSDIPFFYKTMGTSSAFHVSVWQPPRS